MKRLFLIRHAKSSWDDSGLTDYERPLNKRGERDAPFMAQILKKERIFPDAVYSSPAVRAITTAEIFAGEIGFDLKKIITEDSIYDSGIRELESIVQSIPASYKTVFIFGHNPAFTYYANHLGNKLVTNIPTCGIVGIEINVESWENVERGKGKTFFFEFPKKYFD